MINRFLIVACLAILALLSPSTTAAARLSSDRSLCDRPAPGQFSCFARVVADADGAVRPSAAPAGLGPGQLRAAYNIQGSGASKRLAIVDAYGDPYIKADLDTYSRTFGLPVLPVCSSTAQPSCFEQLNQSGGHTQPRSNAGWALETALDVEAAHAICPGCRLDLVQATTASQANLMAAVDTAVATGAKVVSMSWGGDESPAETRWDTHFDHPRVIFTASSGDSGYGTSYPAASTGVMAVGGTSLRQSHGQWTESAWKGSGSGCSAYEPKPSWQHDPDCSRRSIADLSADADPATGAAVYSSLSPGGTGWFVVGGTSLASPLVAGMVAGSRGSSQGTVTARLYRSAGTDRLLDVSLGSNGRCVTYLCQAGPGYDGPTGVGAPRSQSVF